MRRVAPALIAVAGLIAAALLGWGIQERTGRVWVYDFAVNWTAARGLGQGVDLYDRAGLHALALQSAGGTPLGDLFTILFDSYNNAPVTVLLYLPFAGRSLAAGSVAYQVAIGVAFAAAVILVGFALPPADRARAWLVGAVALLLLEPVAASVELGQIDAWVMLALAGSFVAWRRGQPDGAASLAVIATALKVLPGLVLVYYLLVGGPRAWRAAGLTGLGLVGVTAVVAGPGAWVTWLTRILPALADGLIYPFNVAVPAWAARVAMGDAATPAGLIGLGGWRYLALVIAAAGLLLVWRLGRADRRSPLPPALLVIGALLAGPVTWDHYVSWAILPLALLTEARLWQPWGPRARRWMIPALITGGALIDLVGLVFGRRLETMLTTAPGNALVWNGFLAAAPVGLALWGAVGLLLLARTRAPEPTAAPAGDRALAPTGAPA